MTVILAAAITAVILAAACVAQLAWLMHLLHRDRDLIWHPGDPVPDIPADAPIRHWARRGHGRAVTR